MSVCCLGKLNKEIKVDKEFLKIEYMHNSEKREDIVNYVDIKALSFFVHQEAYLLSIYTKDITFKLSADIEDYEQIEACKVLYRAVSDYIINTFSEENIENVYSESPKNGFVLFFLKNRANFL